VYSGVCLAYHHNIKPQMYSKTNNDEHVVKIGDGCAVLTLFKGGGILQKCQHIGFFGVLMNPCVQVI
jgi:hypothetical protein